MSDRHDVCPHCLAIPCVIQHQRPRECTLTTNLTCPVPVLRSTHCRDSGIRSTVASVPWSYSQASAPIAHLFGTSSYAAHSRGADTVLNIWVSQERTRTLVEVLCKQRET
ncbi:hypothetical protein OH76DRAFT_321121 [Lentinus brumalis]|uniref:Uncharacterized protein n=1 Tax=Lentinus brumalis TaxID=2498619 RepID=A0A371DFG8_9APHY|nr:hypothetical protein OH76DRAFT_321121 [Polyporus brumalis]